MKHFRNLKNKSHQLPTSFLDTMESGNEIFTHILCLKMKITIHKNLLNNKSTECRTEMTEFGILNPSDKKAGFILSSKLSKSKLIFSVGTLFYCFCSTGFSTNIYILR